jgi:predicted GNAT superfamily acetyltransferase
MTALTAEHLGFTPSAGGWLKTIGGRPFNFRLLHEWADLLAVEDLQREVFGIAEHDLAAASLLVVIPKTGGSILGAFVDEHLVGFLTAYGGYVAGKPRLVSDMLAVAPAFRGGLGFALKSLQAALALRDGFAEIVWTVDPLRAANARLNFERLGAHAREYLDNFYGGDFALGLYGGLPSDRLVVTWPIAEQDVAARLLGHTAPREPGALDHLPLFETDGPTRARLVIPADIDALVATDLRAAHEWRLRLRAALHTAFDSGYAITGFARSHRDDEGHLLLQRSPVHTATSVSGSAPSTRT